MKIPFPLQASERLSGQRRNFQRELAKWPIPLVLALALSSCVVPPPGQPGHDHGPGGHPPGWSGNESSAYRSGHSDGSRDKRQGRRYEPSPARVPSHLRDEYLRGYRDGYRNANDNPWSGPRAHELGQSHGRRDRMAGMSLNPDRHADEVPRAVRDEFRRGYRDGWHSTTARPPVRPPRPALY